MRFPPRLPTESLSARAVAAGLLLASVLLPISCRLNDAKDEAYFDLEADASLVRYSRVTVELQDSSGTRKAILFDDSLSSVARLRRLPAGSYRGGAARIVILAYRDGRPVYRETRVYDGRTQTVASVDIFLGPFGPEEPVPVTIQPRAPTLSSRMPDTLVSIRDSVALWAEAFDADGDLSGFGLDCDGDGRFEDSGMVQGPRAGILRGRRFADSGYHACLLKVWDKGGRSVQGRLGVRVEWDPPRADAGGDTVVTAGSQILLHARGDDLFGPIVTREWKIGTKPFAPITQQETLQDAPLEPGELVCILRVTDSDGLTGQDTLLVTVIPRTGNP